MNLELRQAVGSALFGIELLAVRATSPRRARQALKEVLIEGRPVSGVCRQLACVAVDTSGLEVEGVATCFRPSFDARHLCSIVSMKSFFAPLPQNTVPFGLPPGCMFRVYSRLGCYV